MSELHHDRVSTLIRGINPQRVMKRTQAGQQLSYLTQADVRATAIRIFGFGGFSVDTLSVETLMTEKQPRRNSEGFNFYVCVRAIVRVRIHEAEASYTEAACGTAQLPDPGQALDMATKTAVSDAMKRAFINLGDQFGLSLYFNGSTVPVVRGLVVPPPSPGGGEDGSATPGPGNTVATTEVEEAVPVEGEFVAEGTS